MSRPDEIRKEILLQLYGCRPLTRAADRIHRDAKKEGYDYSLFEIKQELTFLSDEGLLIRITEPGTTAAVYRIHANGVRHYEEKYG